MLAHYIYFIHNENEVKESYSSVDTIRKSLQKHGAKLCADDLDSNPWQRIQSDKGYSVEKHEVVINAADICVFEYSINNGSFGYYLSYMIQNEKPVLVLYKKGSHPHNFFLHTINYSLLTVYEYEYESEIDTQIKKFIDNYKDHDKTRYNLVINKKLDQYLEWAAFQYKKSKTEVIQDAIDEYGVLSNT